MKKVVTLLLVVAAGIYGVAAVNLSESGANRFLNELEHLSLSGQGKEYCAKLHADLTVSISDHSAEPPADFEGGRDEFCGFVSEAAKGMELLGAGSQVTRDNFTVTRSWLHPWTAHVSYDEDRITTFSLANQSVHTQGEDKLTLVQTLGGVRLLHLESRTWLVR
jgi:hypothetical protein